MNMNFELFGNLIRSIEFTSSTDKVILRIFKYKLGKLSPNDKKDSYIFSVLETSLLPNHDSEELIFYKRYYKRSSAWAYITNRKTMLHDMDYQVTDSKDSSYYNKSL